MALGARCLVVVLSVVVVLVVVQPANPSTAAHAISAMDFFIMLVLSGPDRHSIHFSRIRFAAESVSGKPGSVASPSSRPRMERMG